VRTPALTAVLALWCGTPMLLGQTHRSKEPVFIIRRPTIVAFFPVTTKEIDPDTNEALSDFQFYAGEVRGPLSKRGVDFREVYARSFRVVTGGRTIRFRAANGSVGYYFVAPAKTPRVEYGVEADVDLLQMAEKYFGRPAK
jgi:hypothetical protein